MSKTRHICEYTLINIYMIFFFILISLYIDKVPSTFTCIKTKTENKRGSLQCLRCSINYYISQVRIPYDKNMAITGKKQKEIKDLIQNNNLIFCGVKD